MKKWIFLCTTVLSVTILVGISTITYAEEAGGNTKSNATVIFEENKSTTDPIVPPVYPEDPKDSNGPDVPTGNSEPLRIDIAPKFHFGQFVLGTGEKTANNTRKNSNLQVTDGRGTLKGWAVSVTKTDFKNGTHTLPAMLTLTPGAVKDSTNQSVILGGNSVNRVVVNSIAQPIFSAAENEGGGTYYQNFDGEKATLTFNSDVAKKDLYTSELTWTLVSSVNKGAK